VKTAAGSIDVEHRDEPKENDAEAEGTRGANGSGFMNRTSSDLEFVRDDEPPVTGNPKVGMRFTSITVPKTSVITAAYLTFRAIAADSPNTNSGTTTLTIYGRAADNPGTFASTTNDITNRTLTSPSVPVASWWPNDRVTAPAGQPARPGGPRTNRARSPQWRTGSVILVGARSGQRQRTAAPGAGKKQRSGFPAGRLRKYSSPHWPVGASGGSNTIAALIGRFPARTR
jgi:hypothetical protein